MDSQNSSRTYSEVNADAKRARLVQTPVSSRDKNIRRIDKKAHVKDKKVSSTSISISLKKIVKKPVKNPESSDEEDNPMMQMMKSFLPRNMITQSEDYIGPIYPYRPGYSFSLYVPSENEIYSATNPDGYVPVIVNPSIAVIKEEEKKPPESECVSKNAENPEIPEKLLEFQMEGLKFLWANFVKGQGVLLEHEMGLGKTFTFVAFILTILEQSEKSRKKSTPSASKVLILSPKSIVEIWHGEFKRIPKQSRFKIIKIVPYMKDDDVLTKIEEYFKSPEKQVMIMSYDSFKKYSQSRTTERIQDFIQRYKRGFDLLICDEVHLLKNADTNRVKALRSVINVDKEVIIMGLSGTPFQNTLTEFCTIIDLIRPKVFGPNDYKTKCKKIESFLKRKNNGNGKKSKNNNDDLTLTEDIISLIDEIRVQASKVIQYKMNNYQVSKNEFVICSSLSIGEHPQQSKMYKKFTDFLLEINKNLKIDEGKVIFFKALDHLRKICIHPKFGAESFELPDTISKRRSKGIPIPERLTEIAQKYRNDFDVKLNSRSKTTKKLVEEGLLDLFESNKVKLVFSILQKIDDQNFGKEKKDFKQVVIASFSLELLSLIGNICKLMNYKYLQLVGTLSTNDRQSNIEHFQNDKDHFVFLLSAKAGSTGITLTAANHLIICEPGWNPFDDRQIIFRIYRQTQLKDVFIYRLFSTGTIDELIYFNQISKESFDEYLRDEKEHNDNDLSFLSGSNTMDNYFTFYENGNKSYINDELIKRRREDDYFASKNLESEKKYYEFGDIPDELDILQNVWKDSVKNGYDISFIRHNKLNGRQNQGSYNSSPECLSNEIIQHMASIRTKNEDEDGPKQKKNKSPKQSKANLT